MGLFDRTDPRDLLIESQRSEIEYLRAKVDELQKELLAMTSTSAYRLVHKEGKEADGDAPPLTPIQQRGQAPTKDDLKTVAEIAKQFPNLGGDAS